MSFDLNSIINIAIILISILSVAISALFFYVKSSRQRQYDYEKSLAQLSDMRLYLEREIFRINDRLLTSEERWKDVNHLLISSSKNIANERLSGRVHLSQFLKSFGIKEMDLEVENDMVFVLTPFHPDFSETYQTIQNACSNVGLRCHRGDEQFVGGDLLPHILSLLVKARLVIANVDGRNPNVFYELGIANAIDKPVIIVTSQGHDLPIDLRTRKLIVFKDPADLKEKIQVELTRALVNIGLTQNRE